MHVPAWVTWRSSGDYCGWAPLPPRAEFDIHLGWRYNGVSVSTGFGFGLGSDAFLFVGFGDFSTTTSTGDACRAAGLAPCFTRRPS